MTNRKTFAAIMIAAVGVVVLILAVRLLMPSPSRQERVIAPEAAREMRSDLPRADPSAPGELAASIADHLEDDTSPPALVESFREVLAGYLSAEPDGMLEYCAEHGIEPHPLLLEPSQWEDGVRVFRGARFDPESVELRDRVVNGREIPIDDPNVRTTSRPGSWGVWEDLPREQRNSIEVRVAGEFLSEDGERFPGHVGFEFAHDPNRGTWVLHKVRIYGAPSDVFVRMPPV